MPKITRKSGSKKNRRTSRPNVFAQTQPTLRKEEDNEVVEATLTTAGKAPRSTVRVERSTRIAGARSEIYTRSMPAELRKMGALAGVIVVVLTVLTFTI